MPHALAVTQSISRRDSIGSQDGKREKGEKNDKTVKQGCLCLRAVKREALSIACSAQRRWANLTRQAKRLTLCCQLLLTC